MVAKPMPQLPISDCVDLEGNSQGQVALSGTVAQSVALDGGHYDVWYSGGADCYIGVSLDNSNMTTSTGYLLMAGNMVTLRIGQGKKLGGITAGSTGNLCYHRIL